MRNKPMLAYPVSAKPIDYNKGIWISIFDGDECIFVGKPRDLLKKYYTN